MDTHEMDEQLRGFDVLLRNRSSKTAAELDVLLTQLNDLAPHVHDLDELEQHAMTAKIDELRRQYTNWFNRVAAG